MTAIKQIHAPRYLELRAILADEIESGVHQVGARFPTDSELCERFGVSRHTIREALRSLQDDGLIVRQPGAGTVVRARDRALYNVQPARTLDDLSSYAGETRFRMSVSGTVRLGAALAAEMDRSPSERWLRLAGVRWLRDPPQMLCWTEIFVAERLSAVRLNYNPDGPPVYEVLERDFGVPCRRVDQRITATVMPASVAEVLDSTPGAPALLVRRSFYEADAGGDPYEISLSLHPHDRYAFQTQLSRRGRG